MNNSQALQLWRHKCDFCMHTEDTTSRDLPEDWVSGKYIYKYLATESSNAFQRGLFHDKVYRREIKFKAHNIACLGRHLYRTHVGLATPLLKGIQTIEVSFPRNQRKW